MAAAHSPPWAAGATPDGRQRDAAAALAPEHLARLLELARALAGASEHAEIALIAAERARALTGASATRIAGPRDGGALAAIAEARGGAPARRCSASSASIPARGPEQDVFRGGGPLWLGSRKEASEQCSREALGSLTGGRDDAAWAILPLAADHETGGVLTLSFHEAQPFDDRARAFLGEVAAACGSALARGGRFTRERARANASEKARAACELRQRRSEGRFADRTHLYERERFARARAEAETVVAVHAADDLERVEPLTAALLASDTARDVVAALAEHGPGAFGALRLDLTRDAGGGSPARSEGATAEAEVLREGAPLWLDARELARRFPETSAAVLARDGGSWLGVPVPGGDGARRVLSLAFPRERAFTPGDRARLLRLAGVCAGVLSRCAARDAAAAAPDPPDPGGSPRRDPGSERREAGYAVVDRGHRRRGMTEIGQRIRKMREAQALSCDEVSALVGVPTDRLTEIEAGHGIPSVGLVIKLSRVLGSRVDGILHGAARMSRPLTVCRAGERRTADEENDTEQGYTYHSLGRPSAPGLGMEPLLITFVPGQSQPRPIAHDGQEFVYVLEGKVELLHGDERCTLGPGDSVYLDSTRPHLFRAVGDAPSRAVGVVWSPE